MATAYQGLFRLSLQVTNHRASRRVTPVFWRLALSMEHKMRKKTVLLPREPEMTWAGVTTGTSIRANSTSMLVQSTATKSHRARAPIRMPRT